MSKRPRIQRLVMLWLGLGALLVAAWLSFPRIVARWEVWTPDADQQAACRAADPASQSRVLTSRVYAGADCIADLEDQYTRSRVLGLFALYAVVLAGYATSIGVITWRSLRRRMGEEDATP